jgi:uncharacterized protein (UPF0276 family)
MHVTRSSDRVNPMPAATGIGLRPVHYRDVLERLPGVGWLEVHSENYFGDGGAPLHYLEQACKHYPVSLHGVGMSLGGTDPLNTAHLDKVRSLIDRFDPLFVSDHLCWCANENVYLNDLLPLPYTEEALAHFSERAARAQDHLGRELLIENPSSYLRFRHSTIPEHEFLAEVARRSGCALLLDINNIYVSAMNHGFDAKEYVGHMPAGRVREYHLAGHTVKQLDKGTVHIDTHNARVGEAVWSLYEFALRTIGDRPALIEWDVDLPDLKVLVVEARRADDIRKGIHAAVA